MFNLQKYVIIYNRPTKLSRPIEGKQDSLFSVNDRIVHGPRPHIF